MLVAYHNVDRAALERLLIPAPAAPRPQGPHRRDPRCLRRYRSRRSCHRQPGCPPTQVVDTHSSVDLFGRVPWLHTGLGVPGRSASRSCTCRGATTPRTAITRRLGRHRQRVHGRVSDGQPRRLAPARPHHRADVRRRARQAGVGDGRRSSAIRPHMIEIINPGIGSSFQDLGRPGLAPPRRRSQRCGRPAVAPPRQPPVGNDESAATIETCGGLSVRFHQPAPLS